MEKRFSLVEALRFGFYTLIEHFAFFLALMFTYIGVLFAGISITLALFMAPFFPKAFQVIKVLDGAGVARNEMVQNVMKHLGGQVGIALIIAMFIIFLLNRYLTLGFTKACLELHDHDRSDIKTLFSCYPLIINGAIASLLYWLICSIGFMFFMVPGIYFAIRYGFFNQFIVDKKVGALEAFRLSSELTEGVKWNLFSLWFFLLILNWISLSMLGLSFFITWPLSSLTYIYIYRKLLATSR